ncbi:3-isopropylmalate dehydrogenase [Thermogymnomonas acidicola]|uniref:3-isopropylmalate dehydrogenase n=1 Tax=Thermogymnomonas acidicola TaxID=399579 RepID=A0AA37BQ90_9ARCH|nr:isocitrate/isopropylmalate dehydrogenase family protein [Thermogymnomonas acidicola]GGM69519.1 3-isopropylmalate dehydrogenase [Thermogymnomonas acidicola]
MSERIMVLEGDGIGPEVVGCAIRALEALNDAYGLGLEFVKYDVGARSISQGEWTVEGVIEEARKFRAILKGPMGDPGIRNRQGTEGGLDLILALRFSLDLYANVRPVRLLPGVSSPLRNFSRPDSIDYTLIRENSEGLYASHFGGMELRDEVAVDNQIITRKGVERVSRMAFEIARRGRGSPWDGRKRVLCVEKSNVLRSFAFFRRVFDEVSADYGDVEAGHMYADAMAQYMVLHPDRLNVVVTENMFGDILSDLGAATVGGLGVAYSANLNERMGMFEPVHGSAPDIAGKGIANPVAMLLSASMMLDFLSKRDAAVALESAVIRAMSSGALTQDLGGHLGSEGFTDKVIENMG